MKTRFYLAFLFLSTILCLTEIEIKPIQTPERKFKNLIFRNLLNNHKGNIKDILNKNNRRYFLSHHSEIKKIYREYLNYKKSKDILQNEKGYSEVSIHDRAFYYSQYYCNIEIGNPPQNFNVIIDSGSGILWVPPYNCKGCNGKNKYTPSESSTYKSDNETFYYEYYLGRINGDLVSDEVNLGGLKAINQTFGLVTSDLSPLYEYSINGYDGILGMAYPKDGINGVIPFMFNLKDQGQIEQNIWSIHFTTNYENLLGTGSKVIIGGVNPDYYSGEFSYHKIININKGGWWTIGEGYVDFGGDNNTAKISNFTVDTGNLDAIDYDSNIPIRIPYVNYNCDGIENLPTFVITIGETVYTLEYNFYVYKIQNGIQGYSCTLLMEVSTPIAGREFNIWLGVGFVEKYYTSFDADNQIIGFALNKI